MKLNDLIESLAFSEVGTSKLFETTPKDPNALYEITPRNRAILINHINNATMAICVKLPIFHHVIVIRLVEGKATYLLDSAHSVRHIPDGTPFPIEPPVLGDDLAEFYIYDTEDEPFEDNIITLTNVMSDSGLYNMTIGDTSKKNAVYTPRPNTIEVPEDMIDNDEFISLGYSAHIPRIPPTTLAEDDYSINLPQSLNEAVAAFIAHKLQLQPQDAENTSVGISHMDRFNEICTTYLNKNVHNLSGDVSTKGFVKRGWK
ncbi:virion structural protein [Vibrio phage 1.169.O._10N.261.52.B1]|uniref:Head completion adaptor n=1 Tax=Vibrio phage 1.169.O._10N.261.52.B1 TaxID=1881213 RepID=A0A2I7REE6_9CAUD|nr:virion structural protein [Vibrio phage 1.169.O._10N.261.52.B1]AUR92032.1 head completion adaptor [Vibrio phage 1.169.O._10N.261.52.B1]